MSKSSESRLFQTYNVNRMTDDNGNLSEVGWMAMRQWLSEIYRRLGIISFYEED